MDNTSTPKWDVEIYSLFLRDLSLRTAGAQVCVTTGPGVDVGWISSATVFLFYGHNLIGEMTLENTIINTEISNDVLVLEMGVFEIQDMIAFKSFVRDIMPKSQGGCQPDDAPFTGQLEVVDKGHKLTMTLDLCGIGSLKTTKPIVQLTGDLIEITFSMWNSTPVEIYFEQTEFVLRKGKGRLAYLSGAFGIVATDKERPELHTLEGQIRPDSRRELFGKAVLAGYRLESEDKTWLIHALREFKIEVDLDEMIVC